MTAVTAWELDHIAVRGLNDCSRQCHGVEVQAGQHIGHTLSVKLFDNGLGNLHEASSLGGLVSHDRLLSIVASAALSEDPFAAHDGPW
jgi:hypothetical protein